MLVVQRVFRAKRTNLHEKYDYPVAQGAIADLELGGGSVRDLVAVARALGIVPALLDAMRPQPRTLDELERVEIARLNARPGEIDD